MPRFERTDRGVDPEGKLQKFVKKYYQARHQTEEKSTDDHKEEDRDNPKQIVGEIRMIIEGQVVGGSYKSLRKAVQRQVNSAHMKHPIAKYHRTGNDDIIFLSEMQRESSSHTMTPLLLC